MVRLLREISLLSLFFIWPLLLLFQVPLERYLGSGICFYMLLVGFFSFAFGLITAMRKKDTSYLGLGVLMSLSIALLIITDASIHIFLGKQIGETRLADAPGWLSLKVYDKGVCTLTHGGPIGGSRVYYSQYEIANGLLLVDSSIALSDLEGNNIVINENQVLRIEYQE